MKRPIYLLFIFLSFPGICQWTVLPDLNGSDRYNSYQLMTVKSSYDGKVYVAGNFTNTNAACGLPEWNGSSWNKILLPGSSGNYHRIYDVYPVGSDVYVTSDCVNSAGKYFLFKWNGASWADLGTPLNSGTGYLERICADFSGNVFVTGGDSAGNPFIAKYSAGNWTMLPALAGFTTYKRFTSICVDAAGNLCAAGGFTNSAGNYYVAKWTGSAWKSVGSNNSMTFNALIFCLHRDVAGNLLAGGAFTNQNGNLCVAKFDGSNWSGLGELPSTPQDGGCVTGITSDNAGQVFTCGALRSVVTGKTYLAKWNGNGWTEMASDFATGKNLIISVCLDQNGNLYGAGDCRDFAGQRIVAKYADAVHVGLQAQSYLKGVEIYPNPAEDEISVTASPELMKNGNLKVSIMSSMAEKIRDCFLTGADHKLDISDLSCGLYQLAISDGQNNWCIKFVKH